MESTNLHGGHVVHAPVSSLESKHSSQMNVPTHLTKHGVWALNDIPAQTAQKDRAITLQVTSVKMFAEADKPAESEPAGGKQKPKFRAKYTLSDGVASICAIVVESSYNKFVSYLLFRFYLLFTLDSTTKAI